MKKKPVIIGVITKLEIIHAPKGHTPYLSGTGFYRNRRKDKKLTRLQGKRAAQL